MNSSMLTVDLNAGGKQARKKGKVTVQLNPSGKIAGPSPKRKVKKPRNRKRRNLPPTDVKRSHYAASLHDPWGVRGARIPDERVVPTATISSVFRGTLTSFANPGGGFNCGVMLRLGSVTPKGLLPGDLARPIIYAGPVGAGGLEFNPTSAVNSFDFGNLVAIGSAVDRLRVVSAGLSIWPTLASTQNAGRTILTQYFGADNGSLSPFALTDFIARNAFLKICPVNANEVCSVAYRPQSVSQGFEFRPVSSSAWDQTLVCILDGLSAANLTFDVSIVVNWEVIPSTAFAGIITTEKSYYDVDALMLAFNTSQGTDMFQSFPADAYDATNSMFTDSADSIWSKISSLDPGQIASNTSYALDKIFRVVNGGYSLFRMYKGAQSAASSLGYDRTKMIQYG